MKLLYSGIVLAFLFTVSNSWAETYRWVDQKGVVTFKDYPPPELLAANDKQFNGTVELYITDWCGYCKKAVAYLKSRNIPYVAYDIEKDRAAWQRHKDLGGRGVPLIIIGNNKMSGFSQEAIEHYLGSK